MVKVFVYGTLKPGEVNYSICDRWVIKAYPAIAFGRIYQLPFGYPAMVARGNGIVQGTVLWFTDAAILSKLDEFEQHDPDVFRRYYPDLSLEAHQYQRQEIATFDPEGITLGIAWAYLMTATQLLQVGGVLLPDSNWASMDIPP